MSLHHISLALLAVKNQELMACTLNLGLVKAAELLQRVDAEFYELYTKASAKKETEQEYLAMLEIIYAAMLRAEEAAREAAEQHMLSFLQALLEGFGIIPNIAEEPYLEAEVKRFELQLLQTLERLAERIEKHYHGEKSLKMDDNINKMSINVKLLSL